MSLHNGIDTVAAVSLGVFTKTYGSTSPGSIANLLITLGLVEDIFNVEIVSTIAHHIQRRFWLRKRRR